MLIGESRVECLAVHRVGNPARDEGLQLSERTAVVNDEVSSLILDGYLKGIVSDKKKFQFFHDTDLNLNEVYHYSRQFFRGELGFLELSQRLARHLYARSQHPNISAGDVLVILFSGLSDAHSTQRALGVFKAEIRDDFLKVIESESVFDLQHVSGINPRLIDKGALILEQDNTVYAVDRLGQQAKFWLEDFLHARRVPDVQSSSQMMTRVLEQLSGDIADPVQQGRFKDEFLALCRRDEEVSAHELSAVAERFVEPASVGEAFDSAAQSYGFALDEQARFPAHSMARRLERSLCKVGIGHGLSLLLPPDMSLQAVNAERASDGELTLTLTLFPQSPD